MGGATLEDNPLVNEPSLPVKYAAYVHNRPWLHYPFMGVDVGPGGNAQRLDEKDDFNEIIKAFETYDDSLSAEQTYNHFKNTSLINEKASFPSLAKFKPGLYLIEDRAQESFRKAVEFELAAKLRLQIFEEVSKDEAPEALQTFENLHGHILTSYWLWEKFQNWANERNLNPVPYQVFFDRQFPLLLAGANAPKGIMLRDGRRPRVIKEVQKRGDTVISKTIDTSFKRFEIAWSSEQTPPEIKAEGIEEVSPVYEHEGHLGFGESFSAHYRYIDIQVSEESPRLYIGKFAFNMKTMMWEEPS